ncbi:hypothetical protein [Luteimonas sp. R10]|uniref:hypothetical protein n=1 Tax=Luteimonas sp. R10 TaxID=3108176 RepID=UPI003093AAD4|nr:hypothetical protein U3649_02310 [Luteimonas sp. R10]
MNIIVGSGSSILSIAAVAVALVSLCFAVYSWRQANRPLVSARVTSHSGGNVGIALNLLVENTGNRPARDIRFIVKESDVRAAHAQSSIPKRRSALLLLWHRYPGPCKWSLCFKRVWLSRARAA